MGLALPQSQRNGGYRRRNNDRRCKLQYLRPVPALQRIEPPSRGGGRNRTVTNDLLDKIGWSLNFRKFRSNCIVTTALFAQPLCKFWIAPSVRQGVFDSQVLVINDLVIEQQFFFALASLHLARDSEGLVLVRS